MMVPLMIPLRCHRPTPRRCRRLHTDTGLASEAVALADGGFCAARAFGVAETAQAPVGTIAPGRPGMEARRIFSRYLADRGHDAEPAIGHLDRARSACRANSDVSAASAVTSSPMKRTLSAASGHLSADRS